MKKVSKMIIMMFLLLVGIQDVFSLGIAPASKDLYFEPFQEEEVMIIVMNTENKDTSVEISKEGEMSDYITLDRDIIRFEQNETKKYLTAKVKMPRDLESGTHLAEIIATELPKQGSSGIVARIAVASKIKIRVPYIGKYAEASMDITAKDGEVHISLPINNLGTEAITAKAKLKIFYRGVLDTIETESIDIKPLEKRWLTAKWDAPSIGVYNILAEVFYDDKVIEIEKRVNVGDIFVNIEDIELDNVRLGEVVGFDVKVKSGWNELIEDIHAEVIVKDKEDIIAELKTASEDIDTFGEKNLRAYLDTKGLEEGIYEFNVKLNYAGKVSEKDIQVKLEQSLEPEIIKEEPKDLRVFILIIAIFLIGIIYMLKNKNEVRK